MWFTSFVQVSVSSVQDGIHALENSHMRSTPSVRRFPNVAFKTAPVFVWLMRALSRPFIEAHRAFLFPCHSPPGDRRCDVHGFVPTGSVSSSSTLPIFRDANNMWWLLCPPVRLLDHFPSLLHVQGSTSTGVSEGGRRTLTYVSLASVTCH